MITILQAARYLISLSYGRNGYPLTPLRLQKLLYLAQGWSYVWDNRPLFPDNFEAWQLGPVNKNIYFTFQKYGSGFISLSESSLINDNDAKATLEGIWNNYCDYSASKLVDLTHSQKPWQTAYSGNKIISNESIRDYFRSTYC